MVLFSNAQSLRLSNSRTDLLEVFSSVVSPSYLVLPWLKWKHRFLFPLHSSPVLQPGCALQTGKSEEVNFPLQSLESPFLSHFLSWTTIAEIFVNIHACIVTTWSCPCLSLWQQQLRWYHMLHSLLDGFVHFYYLHFPIITLINSPAETKAEIYTPHPLHLTL